MEEEVENNENFGGECRNDKESTKSYVHPNAQITEGSSPEAFKNGSSNW